MRTFAILALFGLISADSRPAYSALAMEKLYEAIDAQDSSDSSESEDESAVQLDKAGPAYQPWQSNPDGPYERAIPARYTADADDIFMRSVIGTYAVEGKECDEDAKGALVNCKPTGVFTLTKSGARALATEVLGTHAKVSGEAAKTYLDTYFDKAWNHFDVNRTGAIAADKAGAFSRFLLSDQRIQLGE